MEHDLTVYDRETGKLPSSSVIIPSIHLERVKAIARVAPTDSDAIGSYALDAARVREIANLLDRTLPAEPRAEFFLEPAAVA